MFLALHFCRSACVHGKRRNDTPPHRAVPGGFAEHTHIHRHMRLPQKQRTFHACWDAGVMGNDRTGFGRDQRRTCDGGLHTLTHTHMCTHWCCHVRQVPNAFFFSGLISACTQQGVLKGFDQTTNVVLDKCHERVYHGYHEPAEDVPLGLYIIRGDNLFACTHTFSSTSLPFFLLFSKPRSVSSSVL